MRAVQLRPSAIQVVLPDWSACRLRDAIDFVSKIADASGEIGIVLYNPLHARKHLTPGDFYQIKKHVNSLVGCKVAWSDSESVREMSQSVPDVSTFVPGHQLATGITSGARGAYSNVACINPVAAQRWFDRIIDSPDEGLRMEGRIRAFLDECIVPYLTAKEYSNAAVDKFLAAVGGWTEISPRLRWPYGSIPETDIAAVRRKGKKVLPEFFNN
jgi:dihydrodipicolinate synthase/N-acetylneuraminate lyase